MKLTGIIHNQIDVQKAYLIFYAHGYLKDNECITFYGQKWLEEYFLLPFFLFYYYTCEGCMQEYPKEWYILMFTACNC